MAGHAVPHPSKLTYDDYVTLPDDGRRYEILDGELAVSPSPLTGHQRVSVLLAHAMLGWVRERGLGTVLTAPCDVILDETTILQPDLLFVSAARSSIITRRAVEGAPDLVVEILSDSTAARDRGAKMKLYARYGVARYWIIDTDTRTLEIHRLHAGEYVLDASHRADAVVPCDVPPGLELKLAEIWPD